MKGHAVVIFALLAIAPLAAEAASFDCSKAQSVPERIICADPELSALDEQLGEIYRAAKTRADEWPTMGDGATDIHKQWFETNTRTEWKWRERNCRDKDCLLNWYARREAILRWIAYSETGLGDFGIGDVTQIEDRRVIFGVHMSTHTRNYLYDSREKNFTSLVNGSITVVNDVPLIMLIEESKGYRNDNGRPLGAYWYDSIQDEFGNILDIIPKGQTCISRSEFIRTTTFDENDLSRVSRTQICIRS